VLRAERAAERPVLKRIVEANALEEGELALEGLERRGDGIELEVGLAPGGPKQAVAGAVGRGKHHQPRRGGVLSVRAARIE
jgi:hypothetical protein